MADVEHIKDDTAVYPMMNYMGIEMPCINYEYINKCIEKREIPEELQVTFRAGFLDALIFTGLYYQNSPREHRQTRKVSPL